MSENGESGNSALLTDDVSPSQLRACEMVAAYCKPAEIYLVCKELPGGEQISERWVYCLHNPKERPKKWAPLIMALRAEIPLLDPSYRMQQRQKALELAEEAKDVIKMLAVLDGVERLLGDLGQPGGDRKAGAPGVAIQVNAVNNTGGNGDGHGNGDVEML